MLVVQVFLFKNGAFLGTEMASGTRIEIGRDPKHDVVLTDDTVSRSHAFLFDDQGRVVIQDAGSTGGVFVNGERVLTPRVLGPRDDVTIGIFALKFKRMDQPASQPLQAEDFAALPATRADPDMMVSALAQSEELDDETIVDPQMGPTLEAATRTPSLDSTVASRSDESFGYGASAPSSAPAPVALGSEAPFGAPSSGAASAVPTPTPPAPAHAALAAREATDPTARPPHAPMSDEPSMGTPVAPPTPAPQSDATAAIPPMSLVAGNAYFDDDDADELQAPTWSLVQAMVRVTPAASPLRDGAPVVEVIHYRGERVVDHAVLAEGEGYRFGRTLQKATYRGMGMKKPFALVKHKKDHVAEVQVTDEVSGKLLKEGRQVDIRGEAQKKVPLTAGDMASLDLYGDRIFVRLSRRAPVKNDARALAEERRYKRLWMTSLGSGALTWLLIAATAWLVQYRSLQQTVIQLEDDGFAEVFEEREVELEIPEPEEPEEVIPVEETLPEKEEPKVAVNKEPEVAKKSSGGGDQKAPKKVGVLDALDKLPTTKNAGAESLTAATSNIKGVRVPGASGVKVSSLMKKGVDGVSVGGASGGVSTSSLNSLLKKGGGGKGPGSLAGKRNRKVKGQVKTMKRRYKAKGQGTIDKAAVLRVIQSHIGEIQYCYEKQLRKTQGLSGRVQLEWTIDKTGRVRIVKNKQSTLKSAAAISCMIGRVKKWKFPKPSGGDVIISFPFVFNTV